MTTPNIVKLKRSDVSGKVPLTTDLQSGELALNTYDGVVYLKKAVSNIESIVKLDPTALTNNNYILQLNTNGTVSLPGFTLPATDGQNGQILVTNGSGTVSWSTPAAASGAVSYITGQNLTAQQQANARDNISAASSEESFIYSIIF